MHLSTAYTTNTFTLQNGYIQDLTSGHNLWVESGSLLYDGASDPSGHGTMQCIMNCDNSLCCYNAATGANTIGIYCNGDTDEHFYLVTAAQAKTQRCTPLTLYVS